MKFIVSILLFTSTLFGQTGKISSTIANLGNQPIEGAVVSLFTAQDSTLQKILLSETKGDFEFEGLKNNAYFLVISNIGFQNYQSEILTINEQNKVILLSKITLNPQNVAIKEVIVTSKTPYIERKIDRTVVNVDALIGNAGNNALEVLAKSPGILVDQNGSIRLKGKSGVQVFIDDKPTYLSDEELANYLKSLPSSTLKQIKIMTTIRLQNMKLLAMLEL
jgi:iron complex outermembrane recepter protein